jgi:LuxR family maltose regulon positive regulatory protein
MEGDNYTYISLNQEKGIEALTGKLEEIVVIDDSHNINDLQKEDQVLKVMNSHVKTHFILVGRCALPAFLKPYQLTSKLACFNYGSLQLDRSMISQLLLNYELTEPTLPSKIEKATMGYPMAVFFLVKWLSKGKTMNQQTVERMKLDLFDCYDVLVFKYWDMDVQEFMLHMASFETFTELMAGMVTGKTHVIAIINKALSGGSYLIFCPPDTYSIHPVFRNYLLHKQHTICSEEFMNTTYHNAALYYELEDDIEQALYYYNLCKDTDKLAELLILNSNRHPGNGYYYETEDYYRALSNEIILESPQLMCGMSMMCSICCKIEESEYWFLELEKYSKNQNKTDQNYRIVQGKIAYLKIALPHRGSKNITRILTNVIKAYRLGSFQLQEFSVTSNLPSVLNGGKDFCRWSLHDRKYYAQMKKPVELILGRYGYGIADIALAESLFEKSMSDNLTEIMMLVNAGKNAADFQGTLEVEFAAVGILSRVMIMQNNFSSACGMLKSIEERAQEAKMTGMIANIKALQIKFALMEGKIEVVDFWLKNIAQDERKQFRILDRYCYLIKVRCYLAVEKYIDAIALLGRLLDYFKKYDRIYGQLETGILIAITQYYMKQDGWQKTLNETLERCEQYGFIRFIAEEGIALLPLLQKASLTVSSDYSRHLIEETKRYALLYPLYQKPQKIFEEPLTDTEKTVLRLICNGLSNNQISEVMDVTVRTVKFHTGNLYSKMNVKSRSQAIKMATELL